ncbi:MULTISPECIES: hypothetical protein [unclassified Geodermatophilus]|uniref:hypothetical protein n=1 Tax=unclassified Geodermatophilus TaxID=2637632 RepID=UPI003EEA370A
MSRVLAPLTAIVGLAALVVGLVWSELDVSSMHSVTLVGIGALALLVAAAMAGLHEAAALMSRRRRH